MGLRSGETCANEEGYYRIAGSRSAELVHGGPRSRLANDSIDALCLVGGAPTVLTIPERSSTLTADARLSPNG